ncbi:hypothetical protein GCM10020221_20660 [Streptomyces thioluteus]|uniref:Integral membrane protein n=1 Tax=Streptomyces thioluteus TaxID=66431 RepID=A0ABP6J8V9_STRTU
MGTVAYTYICYSTTTVLLLVACLVSGASLAGYDGGTWGKLVLLTAHRAAARPLPDQPGGQEPGPVRGPRRRFLLETPGAALIAALWLGQTPPRRRIPRWR